MIDPELARADAFARRIDERMATRVVPFPGGVAYLDDDYPIRFTANYLWVEEAGAAPAEHWIAEADRILGGAGRIHRRVMFADPADCDRLAMGFIEHGFVHDKGVLLVQRDVPERDHEIDAIEEVSFAEARPFLLEIQRRYTSTATERENEQLVDFRGKMERVVGARFFLARVDDEPAGCCELYVDGDLAQVESVDTLEEFRGRGLASAFVLRAAAEGRAAGAGQVFLWADAEDWPQHWYARLGFREASRSSDFTRWPPGHGPPAASAAGKSPDA
ncbi:MAG: GNAT family N-acetyltransferase [Actinomycetota bacterium]